MRTYGKLRELIRNKFGTIQKLAEASGIKKDTLNRKLLGKSQWKVCEIETLINILEIKACEIDEYFFY